jgi:purine-binding chemotaxis protein CheW
MSDATERESRDLVVLGLGDARFGLWIDEVLEIVRTPPISRLPLGGAELPGVTSVRGDVVPVLDLGVRLLGAPAVRPGRLVLVRDVGSGSVVGLLVDRVETLVSAGPDQVEEPPAGSAAHIPVELIQGVVTTDEGVVTVLRTDRTAAPPVPSNDQR